MCFPFQYLRPDRNVIIAQCRSCCAQNRSIRAKGNQEAVETLTVWYQRVTHVSSRSDRKDFMKLDRLVSHKVWTSVASWMCAKVWRVREEKPANFPSQTAEPCCFRNEVTLKWTFLRSSVLRKLEIGGEFTLGHESSSLLWFCSI